MTSTASFKEKFKQAFSIFKWDLKACTGSLVIYSILAGVFTTIILTLCLVIGFTIANESPSEKDKIFEASVQIFQIVSSVVIYYLTAIFTIIYTIRVFSYLHNKRKADLYGALPISRVTLFLSKSAGAYVYSLVPAYFFLGIIAIISTCLGQPLSNETLDIFKNLIIGTLACVSAYGLLSICSGTTINAVIMFISVCFVYPISMMFIKGVVSSFLVGSYSGIFHNHFIMNALNPLDAYNGFNKIYWLIFTVVCILASALLVRKRKAERAQSSFAYYLPAHILKVLVSFLSGMFLGVLFGSLNTFGYGYFGFVFGFILGSIPAFIISHLILYKGFNKLIQTSIPLGALIFVTVIGMAFLNFDVLGYNNFVPKAEDVVSAGFIESSNCFIDDDDDLGSVARKSAEDYTDKEDINEIIRLHNQYLIGTGDVVNASNKKFENIWYNILIADTFNALNGNDAYCFAYKLDNGLVSYRVYYKELFSYDDTTLDTSNLTVNEKYFEKYSGMVNTDAENYSTLVVSEKSANLYNAEFEVISSYNKTTEKNREQAEKLTDAFKKDFKENPDDAQKALKYISYANSSEVYDNYNLDVDGVCVIGLSASSVDFDDLSSLAALLVGESTSSSVEEYYVVPKSYKNTIAVLKEMGILNDDLTLNPDSEFRNEDYYSFDDYYTDDYYSDIYDDSMVVS